MPPRAKVTKEMIVDAAMEIARESGGEAISARTVAGKLGCSTQPVMYHFSTIDSLKRAAYEKADAYHTAYLWNIQGETPMLDIGLNYVRFGAREKNLFRFLFQINAFSDKSLTELMEAEELQPILKTLSGEGGASMAQAKEMFRILFLTVHGYASMYANNEMEYDEETVAADLSCLFDALIGK